MQNWTEECVGGGAGRVIIAGDEEVERIQDGGKVQKPSRERTNNLRRKNLAIFSTAKKLGQTISCSNL